MKAYAREPLEEVQGKVSCYGLTRCEFFSHTSLSQDADLVLWVGISFEQSASVEYFRRVRSLLGGCGRLDKVKQVGIGGWSFWLPPCI